MLVLPCSSAPPRSTAGTRAPALTLPAAALVPADLTEIDKRKWHKYYVTLAAVSPPCIPRTPASAIRARPLPAHRPRRLGPGHGEDPLPETPEGANRAQHTKQPETNPEQRGDAAATALNPGVMPRVRSRRPRARAQGCPHELGRHHRGRHRHPGHPVGVGLTLVTLPGTWLIVVTALLCQLSHQRCTTGGRWARPDARDHRRARRVRRVRDGSREVRRLKARGDRHDRGIAHRRYRRLAVLLSRSAPSPAAQSCARAGTGAPSSPRRHREEDVGRLRQVAAGAAADASSPRSQRQASPSRWRACSASARSSDPLLGGPPLRGGFLVAPLSERCR